MIPDSDNCQNQCRQACLEACLPIGKSDCQTTKPFRILILFKSMKTNTIRFVKFTLLLVTGIFIYKVFVPRNYDVPPLQKRANTQYWNLQTGSTIGYTLSASKGNRQPSPVIYLHGGPGGHIKDLDINVLSKLSDSGYNVYLYDQTGSGQSGRLADIQDYTVDRHVQELKEIIQKTGAKKVILIAQSWGAILAIFFTSIYPENIEKIIFTSPGPIYPVRKELANLKSPDSFHFRKPYFSNAMGNKKVNNLRTKAMAFFARSFHQKIASDKEADDFQTLLDYEVNKSTVCDTSKILKAESGGGFYAQIMTYQSLTMMPDPTRQKLKNTNIPVLVLKGQCDNQKWGFTNEYLELFPNHQLVVIPNAGHFISVEQPAVYLEAIKRFLNR